MINRAERSQRKAAEYELTDIQSSKQVCYYLFAQHARAAIN